MLAYRRKRRNRRPGRSQEERPSHRHTPSIPAHAAGTPTSRHSERRGVGVPPEEAESSARAKQGEKRRSSPPYPVDSGPRGRYANSTAFRTSSRWRTAGRGGIVGPARSKAETTFTPAYPVDSGPRGRYANFAAFRTSSCWRTAGRGGIVGPGEARRERRHTRHTPSIPAHAAGTPTSRHSERRQCWRTAGRGGIVGPGEARRGTTITPGIPRRFRPTRPVRQLHGIQNVVPLAYRRKRRNRRPGSPMPAFPGGRTPDQWRAWSRDSSVIADPQFLNASARDFRLTDGSAHALGFRPFKTGQPGHTGRLSARRAPKIEVPRAWPPMKG
jgi:hypothetical protein